MTDIEAMKNKAAEMLTELDAFQFRVVLTPAAEPAYPGHKVRTVETASPSWYSQLCAEHVSIRGRGRKRMRRPRTYIIRGRVLAELERIATTGRPGSGVYGDRVGRVVRQAIDRETKPAVTPDPALSAAEFAF